MSTKDLVSFVRDSVAGGTELRPGLDLDFEASRCGGDEDWYRLDLEAGDDLFASVVRHDDPVVGDSIIEIHDANANALIILDVFASVLLLSVEEDKLDKIEVLFRGYLESTINFINSSSSFLHSFILPKILGSGHCPVVLDLK